MKKLILSLFLIVFSIQLAAQTPQTASQKTLAIQNEFLQIIVNDSEQDKGRFSVETTGGDPSNPNDNQKSLIFGRPIPWTSYTTVLIDNEPYVFGGENFKIAKRSGKQLNYGMLVSQMKTNEGVVSEYKFGAIRVVQRLDLFRNPSTKVRDSVLISYQVYNLDVVPHRVGIRVMLDTKLGENDGAPFRIGARAITDEIRFSGSDLQDYWQTFDSLVSPNVIAQGVLSLPESKIFPPDQLVLANWGTLADNVWNVDVVKGRSFVREGELEKDTALALYWDPVALAPNQSTSFKTIYGLGGVSLASGSLSLGLTAPAEAYGISKNLVQVVGYLTNSSGFEARDVKVDFDIPPAFSVVVGDKSASLGTLKPGVTKQFLLKIKPNSGYFGTQILSFNVTSSTLEANQISRKIDLISPPSITTELSVPNSKVVTFNYYVPVILKLNNETKLPIDNVKATLELGENAEIPDFDVLEKSVGKLLPGRPVFLNWNVRLKKPGMMKSLSVNAKVTSAVTDPKTLSRTVSLKAPFSDIWVYPSDQKIKEGDYFYVTLDMTYPETFSNWFGTFSFDPGAFQYLRYSSSPWIRESGQEGKVMASPGQVVLKGLNNDAPSSFRRIGKFHFRALKSGPVKLRFNSENFSKDIQMEVLK